MFDFCLSVPDQVVAFSMDTTDPMHHKLPARPLIKYDIALSQLPLRGTKKNAVPPVDQKRRHAAPGNHHPHFFSLLYQLS